MTHRTDDQVVARARVRIEVELPASGAWGDDATVAQVFEQAGRETVAALRKALPVEGTILGEPHVIAVSFAWQNYAAAVVPADAGRVQVEECRRAFYAAFPAPTKFRVGHDRARIVAQDGAELASRAGADVCIGSRQ